jgi:hypothetical protein
LAHHVDIFCGHIDHMVFRHVKIPSNWMKFIEVNIVSHQILFVPTFPNYNNLDIIFKVGHHQTDVRNSVLQLEEPIEF